MATPDRPHYRLVLRAEPFVGDPTRAMRRVLKVMLRSYGMRCLAIEELPPTEPPSENTREEQ